MMSNVNINSSDSSFLYLRSTDLCFFPGSFNFKVFKVFSRGILWNVVKAKTNVFLFFPIVRWCSSLVMIYVWLFNLFQFEWVMNQTKKGLDARCHREKCTKLDFHCFWSRLSISLLNSFRDRSPQHKQPFIRLPLKKNRHVIYDCGGRQWCNGIGNVRLQGAAAAEMRFPPVIYSTLTYAHRSVRW